MGHYLSCVLKATIGLRVKNANRNRFVRTQYELTSAYKYADVSLEPVKIILKFGLPLISLLFLRSSIFI